MLKELHLKQVGPATHFDVEFGDRLNIFTGDNGLGKSFYSMLLGGFSLQIGLTNLPIHTELEKKNQKLTA